MFPLSPVDTIFGDNNPIVHRLPPGERLMSLAKVAHLAMATEAVYLREGKIEYELCYSRRCSLWGTL
eukprot:scaffold6979_cov77-Skeletonema_marinoi.AAC.2